MTTICKARVLLKERPQPQPQPPQCYSAVARQAVAVPSIPKRMQKPAAESGATGSDEGKP